MQFLSKLAAGGLSAAVVLAWWPHLFQSDSVTSWLLRGSAWILLSEVLILTFAPLEELLWTRTRAGSALVERTRRSRDRILGSRDRPGNRRRVFAVSATVACLVLVPVGVLLQSAPDQERKEQNVHVTKVTTVVRPVERIVKRVEVPRVHTTTVTEPAPPEPRPPPAGRTPARRTNSRRVPARSVSRPRRVQPARPNRTAPTSKPAPTPAPQTEPNRPPADEPPTEPGSPPPPSDGCAPGGCAADTPAPEPAPSASPPPSQSPGRQRESSSSPAGPK